VAPWVRTCSSRWLAAAVDVGFCLLVERLRVWENAVEGDSSNSARSGSVNKVVASGFNVVSPLLLFSNSTAIFLVEG
jgi:hypothetical protein